MFDYIATTEVTQLTPVTKAITLTLTKRTDNKPDQVLLTCKGELAEVIESKRVQIFGQKRITEDVKNAQWTEYCYVLELVVLNTLEMAAETVRAV